MADREPLSDAEQRTRLRRTGFWLQQRHVEALREAQHIERERARVAEQLASLDRRKP